MLMEKEYAKYLLEKTRQDYNLIAEEFSRVREKPWPELRFLFDNYLTSRDRVLDLGCGNGRFQEFLKDKGVDYIGVDPSEKLIEIAKKKYPRQKFLSADALRLPFSDSYFDKVYSIAVLHHIPSDESRGQFLKETKRILKPGGLLILTCWKFHKLKELFLIFKFAILKILRLSKLDFGDIFEPWGQKIKRYYHSFSKQELATLVQENGFKIKDIGIVKNERGNRQNIYLIAEK